MDFLKKIAAIFGFKFDIGSRAERATARFLKREAGLKIFLLNYRKGHCETDIVAYDKKSDCIVFAEVKCRPIYAKVDGYYAATSKKKAACLKKSAKDFLRENFALGKNYRFDVVEVIHDGCGKFVGINHFENVNF